MKKLFILLALLCPLFAWCDEPLMIIHPGRETFVNFPSAIFSEKAVTVFLPEPAVPLRQKYPVIYLLGVGPTDAQAAQQRMDSSAHKALLVGINFDEQELLDTERVSAFISRELVPYIDANYPTIDEPSARGVAAFGAAGGKALAALLAKKNLFTRAALLNGGTAPVSLAGADAALRILLAGEREQVIVWQQTVEEMNLAYGPDFITQIGSYDNILEALDMDYLWADAKELTVKKIKGQAEPKSLSLTADEKATLALTAWLANGRSYDYVPLSLRLSPPYLSWNAASGQLEPISGAAAGKVKISVSVDKARFQTKIRLKK